MVRKRTKNKKRGGKKRKTLFTYQQMQIIIKIPLISIPKAAKESKSITMMSKIKRLKD